MTPQRIFRIIRGISCQKRSYVTVREVAPRDGLQSQPVVPTEVKIEFINKLSETGVRCIESVSFVSSKWIPQMGDNVEVYSKIKKDPSIVYSALVPNVRGLDIALHVGVQEVEVFYSPSETFSRKNTNCTMQEGQKRAEAVAKKAMEANVRVTGYASLVVGCPYEGPVSPISVAKMVETLFSYGCCQVILSDTIGVGTKTSITNMLKEVLKVTTPDKIGVHFHDTYGQGLVNYLTALDNGIQALDSSVAGLGGCPYAPGAAGNVATEDLIYMLHGLGVDTGIDMKKVVESSDYICKHLKKTTESKAGRALVKKCLRN